MNYKTDKMLLNQLVEQKKDVFTIEDSIIIPDIKPDILSIITASPNLYVYKKELNGGRLKIDGGVNIDTIYTADNEQNNTRAVHSTIDFSKVIDIDSYEDDYTFSCKINVKTVEPKIVNGRKISVRADIEYELNIYSNKEIEYIKSIDENEDVQRINKEMNVSILSLKGETHCSAKDSITLDNNIADILCYNISITNKEEKVSYNKVLSKVDCRLDFIYLEDDESIKNISHIIPVTSFIDMPGVDEEELLNTNYEVRNIDIKMDSACNNKIIVDVEFGVSCESYENNKIELIEDLYSPEQEITLFQANAELMENRSNIRDSININKKLDISDVKDNNVFITNIFKESLNQKIVGNSVMYDGIIKVDIIYESSSTSRWEQRSNTIDFSHSVKIDNLNEDSILDTDLYINNDECRSGQNEVLELNLDLNFDIIKANRINTNFISNLKVEEEKCTSIPNSLIIYYVKKGDTLWKVAKKFKTTIDEIAEINNIEDINKIKIGEQLFIPKHVSKCSIK